MCPSVCGLGLRVSQVEKRGDDVQRGLVHAELWDSGEGGGWMVPSSCQRHTDGKKARFQFTWKINWHEWAPVKRCPWI